MKVRKFSSVFFSGAIFLMIIALFGILPSSGRAATIEELRQNIEQKNAEIKRLEEEARKYRDEIASKQKVGKTLKEELLRIDRTVKQLKRESAITEKRIQEKALEIEETNYAIQDKEHSIKKLQSGLASVLQVLSEREQETIFEMLVKYRTLAAFFSEIDYSAQLKKKMISTLDLLHAFKKELEIKKAEAENKKVDLEELKSSLHDQRNIQETLKDDRANLLAQTKNQEKQYQDLLQNTEKKQEAVLKDIEELEESLRKLVDPSSLPEKREGFLKWPANGPISQGYGETPFARGSHFYKFHNGIDIKGSYGDPIFAADSGTVLAVGDTDRYCPRGAYGRYIIIDHKNNLATMYAHLSFIKVGVGQEVKKGDIIGYMGNSGLSTGPHLHFTLYDARTVEIRLGNIGTCGLLPFGGSINPLLYL